VSTLIQKTNALFWKRTSHKPGQPLDALNPSDRKMMRVWISIFDEVQGRQRKRPKKQLRRRRGKPRTALSVSLRRQWRMGILLRHWSTAAQLAEALGVSKATAQRDLDLLSDLFVVSARVSERNDQTGVVATSYESPECVCFTNRGVSLRRGWRLRCRS
jgi:hypothetical protein